MARSTVDVWMDQEFTIRGRPVKRQTAALWLLRLPALIPILFVSHAVFAAKGKVLDGAEADVLGTGAESLLFLTLLVTPVITLTRQRWFAPLRRWYGIMFALTALTDATTASITTNFAGGVAGRLAGHSFLLVGLIMVAVAIPLLATANNPAQRWLGRYWKPLQRMTYAVWGLLFVHLALLEGFGFPDGPASGNPPDGDPVLHQRLYQFCMCSVLLLTLRLPPVKRWIASQQKESRGWLVYCCVLPLAGLFVLGFAFLVNEEIFKGVGAFTLQVNSD
jgi:methionine sulfoxide reductase heme-binding subunit